MIENMKRLISGGSIAVVLLVANTVAAQPFVVSSSAFADNGLLDRKFAAKGGPRKCDGENVSPPLKWSGAPSGTLSYAIMVADAMGREGLGSSHWVVYGIPAQTTAIEEGAASGPAAGWVAGLNTFKQPTYFGPCPGVGDAPHHYELTVIALDFDPTRLPAGLDAQGLLKAIEGHALGATSIIGRYAR